MTNSQPFFSVSDAEVSAAYNVWRAFPGNMRAAITAALEIRGCGNHKYDDGDAITIAAALAKSRGIEMNFERPFVPDSTEDRIYREALRVVAALRKKSVCKP